MRNVMIRIAVVMTIAVVSALTLAAQPAAMRVNVPFQFRAGDQVMPAGEYRVELEYAPSRVVLHNRVSSERILLPGVLQDPPKSVAAGRSALVFLKYGDRHFLRFIHNGSRPQGYALPPSKVEREMAKKGGRLEYALVPQVSN